MSVWRWVVLRCSLEEGMHIHGVFACPMLTSPSHRNPGWPGQPHKAPCTAKKATGTPAAPRALTFLLEIVMNIAARVAGHGKALFFSVREAIGILK